MRNVRTLRLTVIICAVAASVGMAATRAYFVEPRELHEGWTRQGYNTYVGQSFTANVDSISYIEWFVAELSQPGRYRFEVFKKTGSQFVCRGYESVPARGWQWVRCSTFPEGSRKLTKGVDYVVKVSHDGGDSVNYVYRTDNPYGWGSLSVGGGEGQPPPQTDDDLVCRVMGVMLPVDSTYWGFNLSPIVWVRDTLRHTVKERAAAAGMGMVRDGLPWSWIQPRSPDTFDFTNVDVCVDFVHDTLGCEMVGMLLPCAKWASTRITWDGTNERLDTCELCPPRNLWPLPESVNYWARYVDAVVRRYCDRVKTYEVWNEPHLLNVFWQYPNIPESLGGYAVSDTQGMCSLYVRLCFVAD